MVSEKKLRVTSPKNSSSTARVASGARLRQSNGVRNDSTVDSAGDSAGDPLVGGDSEFGTFMRSTTPQA